MNNDTWIQFCFAANDLLAWAQTKSCTGQVRRATAKTIRHRLLHIAGRITPTGQRLHVDQRWPWTRTLLDAINRLRTAFTSLTVTANNPTPAGL